jgi:hypothetical protein
MIKHWHFTIAGAGADGSTFETSGTLHCELAETFDNALCDTFEHLTQGRAVFGKPGVGCRGPYDIHRVTIEQVKQ